MVSGRQEVEAPCSKCGKLWIELHFADRKKRICTNCATPEMNQLSIFSRFSSLTPKQAPERKQTTDRHYLFCESCTVEYNNLLCWLFHCTEDLAPALWALLIGHKRVQPQLEPWYAGKCFSCWPTEAVSEWLTRWRKFNKYEGQSELQSLFEDSEEQEPEESEDW